MGIFLWNKKQWKADKYKIVFLIIYTFIYFKENVFPKYALYSKLNIPNITVKWGDLDLFLVHFMIYLTATT